MNTDNLKNNRKSVFFDWVQKIYIWVNMDSNMLYTEIRDISTVELMEFESSRGFKICSNYMSF